jgi:hypothetical protein
MPEHRKEHPGSGMFMPPLPLHYNPLREELSRFASAQKGSMLVFRGPKAARLLPSGRVCGMLLPVYETVSPIRMQCRSSFEPLLSDRPTWD